MVRHPEYHDGQAHGKNKPYRFSFSFHRHPLLDIIFPLPRIRLHPAVANNPFSMKLNCNYHAARRKIDISKEALNKQGVMPLPLSDLPGFSINLYPFYKRM
jgi:hypothetical protein